MNKIHSDFQKLIDQYTNEKSKAENKAHKYIELARSNLNKAIELSEQYGIPLYCSISPLGNTYYPQNNPWVDKFEKVGEKAKSIIDSDDDKISQQMRESAENFLSFMDNEQYYEWDTYGWQHSAVC